MYPRWSHLLGPKTGEFTGTWFVFAFSYFPFLSSLCPSPEPFSSSPTPNLSGPPEPQDVMFFLFPRNSLPQLMHKAGFCICSSVSGLPLSHGTHPVQEAEHSPGTGGPEGRPRQESFDWMREPKSQPEHSQASGCTDLQQQGLRFYMAIPLSDEVLLAWILFASSKYT